jgi:outer membrane lipase/esterase
MKNVIVISKKYVMFRYKPNNGITVCLCLGGHHMKSIFSSAFAVCMVLSAGSAQAQQYTRAITFGDSLSDNGNIAAANGGVVPNYLPIRTTRFSNGPVWTEQLFGPATNFFTTVNPNAGNVGFAFGGSRTTGAQTPGPTTQEQIGSYLQRGGRFGAGDVVTLWAGANNIFQALTPASANPATAVANMTNVANGAAGDVATQVGQLAGAGAKTILVGNLPSFAALPEFANGPAAGLAGASTNAFNSALASTLAATAAANPGANIITLDTAGIFSAVQANPAAFGFVNASQACVRTPTCVGNPAAWNTFAFWDGVHPTQAGHAIIAQAASLYLTAPSRAASTSNALAFPSFGARRTAVLDGMAQLSSFASTGGQSVAPALSKSVIPVAGKWEYFAFVTGEAASRNDVAQSSLIVGGAAPVGGKSQEYRLGGLRVGGLYNVGNGWTVGAMASATTGVVEGSGGKFEAGTTQISADLLARWRAQNGVFVNLGLGFSADQYSDYGYRTIGDLSNKANAYGRSLSATSEVGYDFRMGAMTLTPQLRASYIRTTIDRYNESGVVAPIAYFARTVDGLAGAAELKLGYQFSPSTSGFILAGYENYLAASGGNVRGRIAGNTSQVFSLAQPDPVGQGVVFGAGVAIGMGSWTGRVSYRGSVGDKNQTTHSANLSASVKF